MDDLIRRQAAIDSFKFDDDGTPWNIGDIIYRLKQFPTAELDLSEYSDKLWRTAYERGKAEAQAERKKGRWKPVPATNGRGGHFCNRCYEYAPSWKTGEEHLTNYCPNCGAYMKGESDG